MIATATARPGRIESTARRILQAVLLLPVVRRFCRPLLVHGAPALETPAILVANHSSHADTAVVLAALPGPARRRLAPAAAQDYFFATRLKGLMVRLLVGAFPFPRRGREGIRRAAALLERGNSVLLFPEGTRSTDGAVGEFKCGVGHLATSGVPVIPVAILGTRDVLPKGRSIPRRAGVVVAFGAPLQFGPETPREEVAARLEAEVRALHASLVAPDPRPMLHARANAIARSRTALGIAFVWGIAEALWWPIVPDFLVAPLVLAAPGRALPLALAATAGSVTGGAASYVLGAPLLEHAPLVTARMIAEAHELLASDGATALWQQPLSGIPYKVFALQAAPHASLPDFLWFTALARGARLLGVAVAFGLAGVILRRWLPRLYAPIMTLYAAGFIVGLARVVAAWR